MLGIFRGGIPPSCKLDACHHTSHRHADERDESISPQYPHVLTRNEMVTGHTYINRNKPKQCAHNPLECCWVAPHRHPTVHSQNRENKHVGCKMIHLHHVMSCDDMTTPQMCASVSGMYNMRHIIWMHCLELFYQVHLIQWRADNSPPSVPAVTHSR